MNFFKRVFRRNKKRRSKVEVYGSSSSADLPSPGNSFLEPPRPIYADGSSRKRASSLPGSARNSFSASRTSLALTFSHRHRRDQSTFSVAYNPGKPTPIFRLPDKLLSRIFSCVCPHALDNSYAPAEETTTEGGCMLCDMRDLSRLSLVCRSFRRVALPLQYTSIRFDSVHYCQLEDVLESRRRRGSVFQKKEDTPTQVPEARLRLLYRALQENEAAAHLVRYLKTPYMIRETCKADLARVLSLTPSIRYADLPEGVYAGDNSCSALMGVLWSRCPELRKMEWRVGSEGTFHQSIPPPWPHLEVVVLNGIEIEDTDILRLLSSLHYLRELELSELPWLSENILKSPDFPGGLRKLTLADLPISLDTDALLPLLQRTGASLESLVLQNTTHPDTLPQVVPHLPKLTNLRIRFALPRPPISPPAVFSCRTLRTLTYDISCPRHHAYYTSLAQHLTTRHFPALKELYVHDAGFHDKIPRRGCIPGLVIAEKKNDHQLEWDRWNVGDGGEGARRDRTRSVFGSIPDAELGLPVPAPWLWDAAEGGGGGGGGDAAKRHSRRGSKGDLWR